MPTDKITVRCARNTEFAWLAAGSSAPDQVPGARSPTSISSPIIRHVAAAFYELAWSGYGGYADAPPPPFALPFHGMGW
jgi:hypothetical protein